MIKNEISRLTDICISKMYYSGWYVFLAFWIIMFYTHIVGFYIIYGFALTLTPMDFICNIRNSLDNYSSYRAEINSCFIYHNLTNNSLYCPSEFKFIPDKEFMQTSIISDFGFVCNNSKFDEYLQIVLYSGLLVGAIISPYILNYFGRRDVLIISASIMSLLGIGATFIGYYWLFCVTYFFMGFFREINMNSAYILGLEYIPTKKQNIFGLFFMLAIQISILVIGILAYFIRNWRWLQIIICGFGLTSPIMYLIIMKSPRLLIVNGKFAQLQKMINNYVIRFNRLDKTLFYSTIKELKDNEEGIVTLSKEKVLKNITFMDVIKSRYLFMWLLIISVNSMISNLLMFSLNSFTTLEHGNKYLNYGISNVIDGIAPIFIYIILKRSRNLLLLINELIGGVSFIALLYVSGKVNVLFVLLCKCCNNGFLYINLITAFYVFPTSVRSFALLIPNICGKIVTLLSPLLISLYTYNKQVPIIIILSCCFLAAVINLFYPELLNKPMPETLKESEALRDGMFIPGCCGRNKKSSNILEVM